MVSSLLVGTLLALLTWAASVVVIVGLGLGCASWRSAGAPRYDIVRRALWWGLPISLLVILTANVFVPLRSSTASLIVIGAFVAAGLPGVWALRRRRSTKGSQVRRGGRLSTLERLLLVMMALATVYLAAAALGPVTNYDSGLYHLGAIAYAGDFATIPGLANLYFPFGYNASLFPAAAFMGNGPWDGIGYRLINGLMISLVMADLAMRIFGRRRTVGTFILMVAVPVILIPMVALSDYWVTSPSTDSAVFALTFASIAYLADAVWSRRRLVIDGPVAFLIAVVLVSLRPLMAVFLITLVVVLIVYAWRSRGEDLSVPRGGAIALLAGVLALALGAVQSVRDYLLSGWLQYPLSVLPFDVVWRAPDPVWNRTPTLGAARDPRDLWAAAEGYAWIPAWLGRLPQQWEIYYVLALIAVAGVVWFMARGTCPRRLRLLLAVVAPSAVTACVWFAATPPSFRFAWGILFSIPVVVIAWALRRTSMAADVGRVQRALTPAVLTGAAVSVILVIAFSALVRLNVDSMTQQRAWALGLVSIDIRVTPIPVAEVRELELTSGLTVLMPTDSDQCWEAYPLCTAQLDTSVTLRGAVLEDGFLPEDRNDR